MKNQFTKFLMCFVMIISALTVYAQNATIRGVIKDNDTKEVIMGAAVRSGEKGTVTNDEGVYYLELPEGQHKLVFSYLGYDNITKEVSLKAGEQLTLDIMMGEAENMLNMTTVTGTKFEKPLGEVTVSLEVVKPSLIENSNANTVEDVLTKVPGLTIMEGQANIRGGSGWSYGAGSRVLLMIDDMPFLQADAGFPNWRDVPVENIEQMEVLKGAASALYGSSALNGIINIRSAYAKVEPYTKASVFSTFYGKPRKICPDGSDNCPDSAFVDSHWWGNNVPTERGFSIAHRQKIKKLDLVLGLNYYANSSYRQVEYSRKTRFNGNLMYNISERYKAGVNFNINGGPSNSYFIWGNGSLDLTPGLILPFSNTVRQTERYTSLPGTFTSSKTFRVNVDPYFTAYDAGGGKHRIQGRYYYINNNNANNQSNQSNLAYGEYQYQRKIEDVTKNWNELVMIGGIVGQTSHTNSQLYGDAQFDVRNLAAYLQLDNKFFDKLNLTFGVRYENNTIASPDSIIFLAKAPGSLTGIVRTKIFNPSAPKATEGKPVFRVGASYQAAEFTYLRASWGQGYRFPTIAEKFIATDIGGVLAINPNPNLKSETGWSSELAIKQGFKISEWMGYIDLAGFWTEYQDMMEFNFAYDPNVFGGLSISNFFFQSQNIGNTRIRGGEISILGTGNLFGAKTNIMAGYTFLDPKFKDFGPYQDSLSSANYNILKYRNKHSLKFDIESTYKKVTIGTALQWNSRMEAIDAFFDRPGENLGFTEERLIDWFGINKYRQNNEKNGWYSWDARVAYNFTENLKLSFLVENITNVFYTIRPALPGPSRSFSVRFDAKL